MTPHHPFTLSNAQEQTIIIIMWCVLAIGMLQTTVYLLQLLIAYIEIKTRQHMHGPMDSWNLLTSNLAMPVSIIVPAYNEEVTICDNVRAILSLTYSPFEVIIVNDGSKDATLQTLISTFALKPVHRAYEPTTLAHKPIRGLYSSKLHPRLLLIDKENGGKADALNAGITLSRYPLFCTVDADSILDPQALLLATQPFLEDPGRVVAVGGMVRIANGCEVRAGHIEKYRLPNNALAMFQTMEYLRAFLLARLSLSRLGVLTIVSGAFGIFRRNIVIEAGGYTANSMGEDFEIVLKLHHHLRKQKRQYRMVYLSNPICWTEVPETLAALSSQRRRWQRGALEGITAHYQMIGNWRYGKLGLVGMPLVLLNDLLGPVAEMLGYLLLPILWAADLISGQFALAYLSLTVMLGVFISSLSLLLEETDLEHTYTAAELTRLTITAVLENLGYRQLNTYWRAAATLEYMLGISRKWEKKKRRGFKRCKLKKNRTDETLRIVPSAKKSGFFWNRG